MKKQLNEIYYCHCHQKNGGTVWNVAMDDTCKGNCAACCEKEGYIGGTGKTAQPNGGGMGVDKLPMDTSKGVGLKQVKRAIAEMLKENIVYYVCDDCPTSGATFPNDPTCGGGCSGGCTCKEANTGMTTGGGLGDDKIAMDTDLGPRDLGTCPNGAPRQDVGQTDWPGKKNRGLKELKKAIAEMLREQENGELSKDAETIANHPLLDRINTKDEWLDVMDALMDHANSISQVTDGVKKIFLQGAIRSIGKKDTPQNGAL